MTSEYQPDLAPLPRRRLYEDGCVPIGRAEYRPPAAYFEAVANLVANPANLESNPKNAGSLSLKVGVINAHAALFVDFLVDSGLLDRALGIACQPLHLTNLMHLVTPPGNDGLGWHRDTHLDRGALVGNVPPVLKVIVYASPVGPDSAGLEVLRGTHRIDFGHRWADKLLGLVGYRALQLRGETGDGLLFDTSVIHRRGRCAPGTSRSATIFGFATVPWQVDLYRPAVRPLIELYDARVSSVSSTPARSSPSHPA